MGEIADDEIETLYDIWIKCQLYLWDGDDRYCEEEESQEEALEIKQEVSE